MPEALRMTDIQTQEFREGLIYLEKTVDSEIIPALARRAALWATAKKEFAAIGVTVDEIFGADIVKRNEDADKMMEVMGEVYAGLQRGDLVVQSWQVVTEDGITNAGIGIIKRSEVPQPSGMAGFPFVPVILTFATLAALTAFGWLILDAPMTIMKNKSEAELLREETAQIGARTVQRVAQTDPDKAAELAKALVTSGRASVSAGDAPADWFSKYVKPGLAATGGFMAAMFGLLAFNMLANMYRSVEWSWPHRKTAKA